MNDPNINNVLKSLEGLYLAGKFPQAQALLLEHKDFFLPSLFHYNLGTIYLKQHHYPLARFHLEKSFYLGNTDVATWHNLALVKEKLMVKDLSNSPYWRDQAWDLAKSIPSDWFLATTLLLLVVSLYGYYRRWWQRTRVVLVLCCLSCGPYLWEKIQLQAFYPGIILEKANAYEGPSAIFSAMGELPAGTKVVVGKSYNGWSFIHAPVFLAGWIPEEKIAKY